MISMRWNGVRKLYTVALKAGKILCERQKSLGHSESSSKRRK